MQQRSLRTLPEIGRMKGHGPSAAPQKSSGLRGQSACAEIPLTEGEQPESESAQSQVNTARRLRRGRHQERTGPDAGIGIRSVVRGDFTEEKGVDTVAGGRGAVQIKEERVRDGLNGEIPTVDHSRSVGRDVEVLKRCHGRVPLGEAVG